MLTGGLPRGPSFVPRTSRLAQSPRIPPRQPRLWGRAVSTYSSAWCPSARKLCDRDLGPTFAPMYMPLSCVVLARCGGRKRREPRFPSARSVSTPSSHFKNFGSSPEEEGDSPWGAFSEGDRVIYCYWFGASDPLVVACSSRPRRFSPSSCVSRARPTKARAPTWLPVLVLGPEAALLDSHLTFTLACWIARRLGNSAVIFESFASTPC